MKRVARVAAKEAALVVAPLAVPITALWCVAAVMWAAASAALVPLGVGLWLFPPAARGVTAVAGWARRQVGLSSAELVEPAPPFAGVPPALARVWRCWQAARDPRLWRGVWWGLVGGTLGLAFAAVPVSLVVYGAFGAFVQPFVWRAVDRARGNNWYTFVHVETEGAALWSVAIGVVLLGSGMLLAGPVRSGGQRLSKALLQEPRRSLQQRVEHLSRTRGAAVDRSSAQVRQIERDLHDGAQARLVAMGMTLSAAEDLISTDPGAARALLVEAREASSRALEELRNLVRGIHPPVLADRGLPDALRALAFDVPNKLVVVEDPSYGPRLAPALEAALYFAAREAVTNAVKHAPGAPVVVRVTTRGPSGPVRVEVRDEGPGGARQVPEGGIAGIAERLAVFDGAVALESPPGGPTTLSMEVPCASL